MKTTHTDDQHDVREAIDYALRKIQQEEAEEKLSHQTQQTRKILSAKISSARLNEPANSSSSFWSKVLGFGIAAALFLVISRSIFS